MAGVKTAARMEAEAVCKRFPDAPNLQLARKLRDEFPCYSHRLSKQDHASD